MPVDDPRLIRTVAHGVISKRLRRLIAADASTSISLVNAKETMVRTTDKRSASAPQFGLAVVVCSIVLCGAAKQPQTTPKPEGQSTPLIRSVEGPVPEFRDLTLPAKVILVDDNGNRLALRVKMAVVRYFSVSLAQTPDARRPPSG